MKKSKYGKVSLLLMSAIMGLAGNSVNASFQPITDPQLISGGNGTVVDNNSHTNSTLKSYYSSDFGGGIYHVKESGTLNLNTTSKTQTYSNIGAMIELTVSTPATDGSLNYGDIFEAGRNGGVIYNAGNLTIGVPEDTIAQTIFKDNFAAEGGAIVNYGTANIYNASFDNNQSLAYYAGSGVTFEEYPDPYVWDIQNSGRGGAIANFNNLSISNSEFSNNKAGNFGGAIYNGTGGNVDILSSQFNNNFAQNDGGAIYNYVTASSDRSGIVTVRGGSFTENFSKVSGGAIYNSASDATGTNKAILSIDGTEFINNAASIQGGAIHSGSSGGAIAEVSILDSSFEGNGYLVLNETETIETRSGGAISNTGTLSIDGSRFLSNKATWRGGALYNSGRTSINDTEFTSNSASDGGAIYNDKPLSYGNTVPSDVELSITNSTFKNNSADEGGAIHNLSNITVIDSNFEGNSATNYGGAIYGGVNSKTTVIAQNQDVNFVGSLENKNTDSIHLAAGSAVGSGGIINLNAHEGRNINLGAKVTGGTTATPDYVPTINVNQDNTDYTGNVNFNSTISDANLNIYNGLTTIDDNVSNSTITTHGGTLHFNKDEYLGTAESLETGLGLNNVVLNGGTVSVQNDAASNIMTNSFNVISDTNIRIDVDLINNVADRFIATADSTGTLTIDSLNILGDDWTHISEDKTLIQILDTPSNSLQLALGNNISTRELLSSIQEEITQNITKDVQWNDTLSTTTISKNTYGILGLGTTNTTNDSLTVNKEVIENVISATVSDTLQMWNNFDSTEEKNFNFDSADNIYTVTTNLGETKGAVLNINGVVASDGTRSTIDFNRNSGFNVKDLTQLNINKVGLKNATDWIINNNGITTITDSKITNNYALEGGAIYNGGSKNATLNIKNSSFDYNGYPIEEGSGITSDMGGAIYNNGGEVNITENSSFSNNVADSEGGAIYNALEGVVNIASTTFTNNGHYDEDLNDDTNEIRVLTESGGAIYNNATMTIADSSFTYNAAFSGGAIHNAIDGVLDLTNVTFSQNTSTEYDGDGGAIFNEGKINQLTGTFTENSSHYNGGAITNLGEITSINGTFTANKTLATSEESLDGNGGAIDNDDLGNIGTIAGLFEGNIAANNGGAISNNATIGSISAEFENNSAQNGGAIYTKNNLTLADSNFMNNKAFNAGGAIYSTGETKITALNKDVKFSGNTAAKGGDIYLSNNTLYLNANQDKTMSFDGGIVGNNAVININDSSINSLYENLTSTGKIIIDNYVSADTDSTLAINLNGGTLKLGQDDYLNGTNLTLNEGSTLDLINDKAGMMNLNSLNANNANLNIDVDLASQNIDTLNGQTISGTLNLKEINLLSDLSDGVNSMTKELGGLNIITPQDGISVATHDYIYTVKANDGNLSITRPVTESGESVKTDGFTVIFNQNDSIGGLLDVNLSDDRIFSAIEDIIITGINSVKGWLGELEGNSLTIEGNGNNLEGGDNIAIIVNVNQTLNFNDTNIKGFETNDDRKGALTVKDGGTLNIHAKHHDVELKTDNDRHNNAIYMEGSGSKSSLTTSHGKKIDVHNDIRSSNQSNHMHLKGHGRISFKGIVDPLTITNENADTVHENYIDDVIYNLNSGTVSFTKDEYLNGQGNKNVLNFNGGTLNIANNAIGNIDLASLNLNSNSNIMVDADLANKTMDRIIADSVSANTDAKLNVSHINLLSDAKEDSVSINAVDPSVTLAGGETFASHISTTVKEVAYSPLYKYTVDYNSSTGDFSFTRPSIGGSGGSTGAPNYNSLNPAVMTSPVSAQLGGYVNMVETYNNAFNNMDMRMLTGSALRYANKNANRYAISEGNYPHFHTTPNTGAMWVRPFASYDSVGLKNGPSVSSFSYGTFLGGDTAIHHFGNGAEGVLSVHASYLGSHQSFAGNSIYNNGGNLGLTGTIYKGNFFNGLTVNVGASISDASTMYGSEDFPMLMSGVANKMGYNFEFKDGRFIVQPSLLLSYTFVNTFDYTNGAGVRIDSDPLHAMQISPNVRFAMNTQGGWQPYLTVGMNWNLFTDTEFKANDLTLPYLSVKPYVQYGVGIQRVINDNFTAFAQVLLRHGGRNGVAGNLGLKFMIGEEVL